MSAYRHITVSPVSGAIGAEVGGVDLGGALDDAVFDEIHRAFLDHLVLFFRGQDITPDQYLAFAERFGPIADYPFAEDKDGHPGITEIVKEAGDTMNFGGLWHADTTYQATPPIATLLHARETPPVGGDTMFANMYLAYESLSNGMKRMLDPLRAVSTASLRSKDGTGARAQLAAQTGRGKNVDRMDMAAEHPVIRTHPETGRKALYVNCAHTSHFAGMTPEESAPLLRFLFDHLGRPEYTCRFAWQPGDLTIWDNRCAQHYALNDYHGHRRLMHRITIEGARPE